MITKADFQDWRSHPITKELKKALEAGNMIAVEELISARGTDGDFYRGAIQNFNETLHLIGTGEGLNIEG